MNQFMNDEGVYRTDRATPGLLKWANGETRIVSDQTPPAPAPTPAAVLAPGRVGVPRQ